MVLFTFSPPHPSPFGMLMPNRDWSAGSGDGYRFGFGGQEQVDEVYGNGNLNTAMFWEYDPRLGRRWNIDPIVKHFEAPYTSFGNNPIFFSDLLGNDKTDYYDIGSGEHLEHVEDGIDEAVGINRNNFNGLKADGNLSNANAKAAGGIGLGSNTAFVALAATIYAESSDFAPKEEAYALGTQFVNLASGANVSLDKMVTNANDQLYGVGSNKYNKFKSTDGSQVNPLFFKAAMNAKAYQQQGFSDYDFSIGAVFNDGPDVLKQGQGNRTTGIKVTGNIGETFVSNAMVYSPSTFPKNPILPFVSVIGTSGYNKRIGVDYIRETTSTYGGTIFFKITSEAIKAGVKPIVKFK